jgi:hypothetical protein
VVTGQSVTRILLLKSKFKKEASLNMNKMPIDWYSKKQATVETATYGSEFIAAQTCINQVIKQPPTDPLLPGGSLSVMLVTSSVTTKLLCSLSQPHAKLHERHNALSFHWVQEAITSKYIIMTHMPSADSPADILSKQPSGISSYLPNFEADTLFLRKYS